MLSVKNLSFRYSGQPGHALKGVSFECESEGVIAIAGRSGIGKSTLISVLAGIYVLGDSLVDEFRGEISLDGHRPGRNCGPALISWVPQVPALLDHLSVLDNVLLPLTIEGVSGSDRDRAEELLQRLGLGEYPESRPRELSGGMKTRVSLLRALISEPRYLFLDEPFISLDLGNRLRIYKFLRTMRSVNKPNATTILTTHNVPEATLLADRIIVMKDGEMNTDTEVFPNDAVLAAVKDGGECLRKAREVAAKIEKQLFLVAGDENLS